MVGWLFLGSALMAQPSALPFTQALPSKPSSKVRDRLLHIRQIEPKVGLELIRDPWYLGLVRDRSLIAEGLLACMGDATRVRSPYSEPTSPHFALGDLAFSILCDLELVDFDGVASPLVGEARLKAQGRFALEDWLQHSGHRAQLQQAAKAWYRSHPPRDEGWWSKRP